MTVFKPATAALFVICGLLAVNTLVHARVHDLEVDKDNRRMFHIQSFGYEPGGHFGSISATLRYDLHIMLAQIKAWGMDDNAVVLFVLFVFHTALGASP